MPEEDKLVEFEIKKDYLIDILTTLANATTVVGIRIIHDDESKIQGIMLDGTATLVGDNPSEFRVMFPIFKDDELVTVFKAFEKKPWPLSFMSCAEQYVKTLSMLRPKEDGILDVKLFSFSNEAKKQNLTAFLVKGYKGAMVVSQVTHPDSIEEITSTQDRELKKVVDGYI